MNHLDMDLLNPVSIAVMRDSDLNINLTCHLATILARQADDLHPLGASRADGLEHIGGIPTGAESKQNIALIPHALDESGKNSIIAIII